MVMDRYACCTAEPQKVREKGSDDGNICSGTPMLKRAVCRDDYFRGSGGGGTNSLSAPVKQALPIRPAR